MPSEHAPSYHIAAYIRLLETMAISTYSTIATAVETRQNGILYANASTTKKNPAHFSTDAS